MSSRLPRLCEHQLPRLACPDCKPTKDGSAAQSIGKVLVRLMDRDTPDRQAMRALAQKRRAELKTASARPVVPTMPSADLIHRSTLELQAATRAIRDAREFIAEKGLTEEYRAWRLKRAGRRR